MKVLLTVGHTTILLPDDSGITTVMKTLARGICVYDHTYRGEIEYTGELNVEMKLVRGDVKIVGKPKSKKEPELLCLEEPKAIIIPPSERRSV